MGGSTRDTMLIMGVPDAPRSDSTNPSLTLPSFSMNGSDRGDNGEGMPAESWWGGMPLRAARPQRHATFDRSCDGRDVCVQDMAKTMRAGRAMTSNIHMAATTKRIVSNFRASKAEGRSERSSRSSAVSADDLRRARLAVMTQKLALGEPR